MTMAGKLYRHPSKNVCLLKCGLVYLSCHHQPFLLLLRKSTHTHVRKLILIPKPSDISVSVLLSNDVPGPSLKLTNHLFVMSSLSNSGIKTVEINTWENLLSNMLNIVKGSTLTQHCCP